MYLTNIKVFPQTKVIVDKICQKESLDSLVYYWEKERIDADVLAALLELVKIYIREILRSNDHNIEIIDKAVEKAINTLNKRLSQLDLDSKFSQERLLMIFDEYLERIKDSLIKKPSRSEKKSFAKYLDEIVKEDSYFQNNKLLFSTEQVNEREEGLFDELLGELSSLSKYELPKNIKLELIKISFNGFTEGLLIHPLLDDLDELTINIQRLPNGFNIKDKDNYFPYEIQKDEFVFILDDDGTIFTYVENFTSNLFYSAGSLLIDLAIHIYRYAN